MINITTKQLEIESELKKKIEFICDFCNTKPTFINGNIRNITRSNLSYIEPHRIIIKGIIFLAFNSLFSNISFDILLSSFKSIKLESLF